MIRILGIELRRSVAPGAALLIAVVGTSVLHATAGRWSTGWTALAMTQREYLAVMSPLAMAAGAWQSYREHRANVAELFACVPRPRPQHMMPILVTTGLAVLVAYLLTLLAAAPRIADTAHYLPSAAFAVVGVGLVAMIASVWLGLAVGRLVPALATAPALAVIGYMLLVFAPHALPDEGLMAAFSPSMGMSMFSDYDTVGDGVSTAQALWMVAVAMAGVVLFAVRKRKFVFAALLPLAIGARPRPWSRRPAPPTTGRRSTRSPRNWHAPRAPRRSASAGRTKVCCPRSSPRLGTRWNFCRQHRSSRHTRTPPRSFLPPHRGRGPTPC